MSSNIKVQRICQQCGQEFIARTTVTAYCSHNCARQANKDRKRDEQIDRSNREMQMIRKGEFVDLLKKGDSKNIKAQAASIDIIKRKDFLSITETCQLLSISRWTIWRAINNGQLVAAKIGRRSLIRRADLDRLFGDPAVLPEIQQQKPATTVFANFDIAESYTLTEIQEKYHISEKALYELIKRNNIPKIKKGWYAYVPKEIIDNLLK